MIPLSAFIVDIGAAVVADLDEAIGRQALWGGDVGTLLPLGLSGTDLSSLDGSTTVAEQAVREQLSGVLDELVEQERTPR